MPRVHSVIARKAQRPRSCAKCGESIEVGQRVYRWSRRFGRSGITYFQHQDCGFPRPSQLSSRKTAVIEEAIQDADFSFSEELPADAEPGGSYEVATDHVESVLSEIADVADEVGDEYSSNADAMPEGLQYGYQAEAMRDVGQRLQDWAEDLRSASFDSTVEFRDLYDSEDMEAWRNDAQVAIDEVVEKVIEDAQEAISEIPEYEG